MSLWIDHMEDRAPEGDLELYLNSLPSDNVIYNLLEDIQILREALDRQRANTEEYVTLADALVTDTSHHWAMQRIIAKLAGN